MSALLARDEAGGLSAPLGWPGAPQPPVSHLPAQLGFQAAAAAAPACRASMAIHLVFIPIGPFPRIFIFPGKVWGLWGGFSCLPAEVSSLIVQSTLPSP